MVAGPDAWNSKNIPGWIAPSVFIVDGKPRNQKRNPCRALLQEKTAVTEGGRLDSIALGSSGANIQRTPDVPTTTTAGGWSTANIAGAATSPEGFATVIWTSVGAARSLALMAADKRVGERNVVERGAPFHRTVAPGTNPAPSTVRVKGGAPAEAEAGLSEPTDGG